jgi:hypothetical protein
VSGLRELAGEQVNRWPADGWDVLGTLAFSVVLFLIVEIWH